MSEQVCELFVTQTFNVHCSESWSDTGPHERSANGARRRERARQTGRRESGPEVSGAAQSGAKRRGAGHRALRRFGARERAVASASARWAGKPWAGRDLVADLVGGRHVDGAREALQEVRLEVGHGPGLADEVVWKLVVVQLGERAEEAVPNFRLARRGELSLYQDPEREAAGGSPHGLRVIMIT